MYQKIKFFFFIALSIFMFLSSILIYILGRIELDLFIIFILTSILFLFIALINKRVKDINKKK